MKLIDKDKVTAEIDRRIADNKKDIERASHKNLEDYFEGYEDALVLFKEKFLDTIETKEVNLDDDVDRILEENDWDYDEINFYEFAKYFYELGLKTNMDDEIKKDIVAAVETYGDFTQGRKEEIYAWLKSLKPKNQWKPSEEQITWLYRAADDARKDSRMKQVLNELLEQLKKLTK